MVSINNLLGAAVGFGAANRPLDVRRIQILLNAVPMARGSTVPVLAVDGLCGPLSCGAIRRFQGVNLGFADGVISPGQKTVMALTTVLQGLGLLTRLPPICQLAMKTTALWAPPRCARRFAWLP